MSGFFKVFQANFDTDTIVRNTLLPAIVARIVRLHIQSWNDKIAMRVEFFGTYEGTKSSHALILTMSNVC
jgi:hypothetical protein